MSPQGSIFEGKTREEAVDKGLRELRMDRADVYVEVVEEGSSGFLGFGGRPYRVRLIPRVRRGERPPRAERAARGGSGRGRSEGPRPEERPRDSGRGDRGDRRGGSGRRERAEPAARESERMSAAPAGGREGEGRGRRRRGGRGRGGSREGAHADARPARDAGNNRPAHADLDREEPPRHDAPRHDAPRHEQARHERHEAPRHEPRERRASEHGSPDREHDRSGAPPSGPPDPALAEQARALAADLFGRMGFDAKVAAEAAGEVVNVKVEIASEEDLLIGKKGEVRQALQQLLNRMLNKDEGTRYHLHLEINDFWQRRETELADMARQLADEASESGRELLTEYLNAQERRVVHVALREDARVKTYAIGDGLIKKVAIAPADSSGPSAGE